MGFADWMALAAIARPDLRDQPLKPARLWRKGSPDIFDEIRYRDQMVHHPFDSFQSVESFVDAAIDDPRVVAIKMTLYRIGAQLAGRRSAHQGGRARQAGRGARRAEGAIRRAQQHRVGETTRRCRRARRLWRRKAEDALQDLPRRPEGRRRDSPVRAHRHRQLQPDDRAALYRHRPLHGASGHRRRTSPSCSTI